MRQTRAAWYWTAVILVAFFSQVAICRRGSGGRGGGSSKGRGSSSSSSSSRGGFHVLPKSSSRQSSSGSSSGSRGAKIAGAAAVGAAVGYGLSSLGKSRYSRGGQSSSVGAKSMAQSGFQNPNWSDPMMKRELYSRASKEPRRVTLLAFCPVLGGVLCFLIQH